MSAPVGWPFGPDAYAAWRPCGCYWMRAGMGVVIAPCATHAEAIAAEVRREDEAKTSPKQMASEGI